MPRNESNILPHHAVLRTDVSFTAENDHNPLIWEPCPRCSGSGKVNEYDREAYEQIEVQRLRVCPTCEGRKTTGNYVRYFNNDSPTIDVRVDQRGWLTCPMCGWRFTIRDNNVWTGLRHSRCGQRIRTYCNEE